MRASRIVQAVLLAATTVAPLAISSPVSAQTAAPHADAITAARLRADLMFLAGDGLRGRLTDTPENALALEWIKARFEWLGLAPAGEGGSYFLPYQLMTSSLGEANELSVDWGTSASRHPVGGDFHPRFHSASGRATGGVAFVGFGISAPALGHDDLAGDVRGNILLMLDNEPGVNDPASPFDGVVNTEYASQLRKTLAAQARGAAGVLFVADVHNRRGVEDFDASTRSYWPSVPARIPRYALASWMQQVRIPAGQVSIALAEQLVQGAGKSLLTLAREAETSRPPRTLPGVQVTLGTDVRRAMVRDRNVVAMLEGGDPVLKDEYVIIAAHPDHNGADETRIFNGADDNGSGTVGLLAIADAYARAAAEGMRPRRSILLVALNSEERGPLMGAWGYVADPVVPLARTVAMLNMDMIGRNEEVPADGGGRFRGLPVQSAESNRNSVNLYGFSRSTTLTAAIDRANAGIQLTLEKRYDNNSSQLLRRTDMWAFQQSGVPAVTFATGLHPDYHTERDRPERIEYAKMERIVRLVYQASWELANAPGRPVLDKREAAPGAPAVSAVHVATRTASTSNPNERTTPMAATEWWQRGPVDGVPALLQPVAHILLQVGESVEEFVQQMPGVDWNARPAGVASPAFHLLHIPGVIDRLFTYARGEALSDGQFAALKRERVPIDPAEVPAALAALHERVAQAVAELRAIDVATLGDFRAVGRAQLPSTVIGCLVHGAEHAMRHVGQLSVTMRVVYGGG